jgi:hypothetical protein
VAYRDINGGMLQAIATGRFSRPSLPKAVNVLVFSVSHQYVVDLGIHVVMVILMAAHLTALESGVRCCPLLKSGLGCSTSNSIE